MEVSFPSRIGHVQLSQKGSMLKCRGERNYVIPLLLNSRFANVGRKELQSSQPRHGKYTKLGIKSLGYEQIQF